MSKGAKIVLEQAAASPEARVLLSPSINAVLDDDVLVITVVGVDDDEAATFVAERFDDVRPRPRPPPRGMS